MAHAGRYLAFPPELSSPEESVVTLVGSLAFVRPKLVVLPSEATPFFVFRGTAAGTDAEYAVQ